MSLPWQERYDAKLTVAEEALSAIDPGAKIFFASGVMEPRLLIEALSERARGWDPEAVLAYALEPSQMTSLPCRQIILGWPDQDEDRRFDALPAQAWDLARLFQQAHLPLDVALVQVTPPDEHGFCSLGAGVDVTAAAIRAAKIVIAQVNSYVPWSWGESMIHVDQLDLLVEHEMALPVRLLDADDQLQGLAQRIASLVPDEATLQIEGSALGEAVWSALDGHHDLGLHTEAFTEGMMNLLQRGVITNAAKTTYSGKTVASQCWGSEALYRYVHDNQLVVLQPYDQASAPTVVAANRRMTTVNAAHGVCLSGQAMLRASAERGNLGALGFIRGAAQAADGCAILALPPGAAIVASQVKASDWVGPVVDLAEVDYVVSAYGVASLRGRSRWERTVRLIEIAPADQQEALYVAAQAEGLLPEQGFWPRGRYPVETETTATVGEGLALRVRPVRRSDDGRLRDLFYALSPQSLYFRFFRVPKSVPEELVRQGDRIDYDRELTLVGLVTEEEQERIVAVSRYVVEEETGLADVALLVQDDYQRQGIGFWMLNHLGRIAQARGLAGLKADVLVGNTAALRLVAKSSYEVEAELKDGYYAVAYRFDAQTLPLSE
jgi:acyl-CoA hydrolase/GNAT superfamily N-acetyltransferase